MIAFIPNFTDYQLGIWIELNSPNNQRKWPELHGWTNKLHKVLFCWNKFVMSSHSSF